MPKQIIRFKCDYCKKTYASKYATIKHECICFYNEAVKSCITCNNTSVKEVRDNEGNIEDSCDYCFKMSRQIFHKGWTVRKCPRWEPIEHIEQGMQDDF